MDYWVRVHDSSLLSLICGTIGFDTVNVGPAPISHWWGINEVLEANGCEVLVTRVPATSSVEDRAKVLEATISEKYPGRSVHLIGMQYGIHSIAFEVA